MIRWGNFNGEIRYLVQGDTMVLDVGTSVESLSPAEQEVYVGCGGRLGENIKEN